MRDVDETEKPEKKTLPVRLGKGFGKAEFIISLFLPFIPVFLYAPTRPFLLMTLSTLLLSFPLIRTILTYTDPRTLNSLFPKAAQLQTLFTLLFCIGWASNALVDPLLLSLPLSQGGCREGPSYTEGSNYIPL